MKLNYEVPVGASVANTCCVISLLLLHSQAHQKICEADNKQQLQINTLPQGLVGYRLQGILCYTALSLMSPA